MSLRENTVLEWEAEYIELYGLLVADDDGKIRQGAVTLSDASHAYEPRESEFSPYVLADSWRFADLANPRTYWLRTTAMFDAAVHPLLGIRSTD